MPPDVTVSIVNHESRDAVLANVQALLDDTGRAATIEIVVVDNVSQDGSVDAIRARFPTVRIVAQDRRHGFGANHNAALRVAEGRHVLLLNDDTLVTPGAIDALAGYLDAHPHVGLAAPRVVDHAGRPQVSTWPLPTVLRDVTTALTLGRFPVPQPPADTPRRVGWAMGCALMARRAALASVGGFDERFFMYSEEIDLSTRLAAAGFETHVVPAASVVHEGQASTGGHGGEARAVEMARSRRLYWERHYSRGAARIARMAVAAEFGVLAAAAALRGRPARAFRIQAGETWRPRGRPGLRESAAAFDLERLGKP